MENRPRPAPNRGKSGSRFSLALTVSAEQLDTAVKLMGEVIAEVSA